MSPLTSRRIADCLDQELNTQGISDKSLNGLQVEGSRTIRKVALAVDAGLATIRSAKKANADLLIVHHGLWWGQSERLVGGLYARVKEFITSGMGLYASHLPLDLHPRLGNNACLAKGLGLSRIKRFGNYHGISIGCGGQLTKPQSLKALGDRLRRLVGQEPKLFSFKKGMLKKVAIVSGDAGDLVEQAAAEGYDVFITGEISHSIYHTALELGIAMLVGGHYATETLGVKAIGEFIHKRFKIEPIFIDFPTGL